MQEIKDMVTPVNGQLVLVRDTAETETETGLYIGDEASKKIRSGVVVCVADDCELPVSAGQRVGYQRHAGSNMQVIVGGKAIDIVLMPQNSVTMILSGEATLGVSDV